MWIQMNHYVKKNSDGLIHVQNVVMGYFGQHHVHTEKDFQKWVRKNKIAKENIIELKNSTTDCPCELKAEQYADGYPEGDCSQKAKTHNTK